MGLGLIKNVAVPGPLSAECLTSLEPWPFRSVRRPFLRYPAAVEDNSALIFNAGRDGSSTFQPIRNDGVRGRNQNGIEDRITMILGDSWRKQPTKEGSVMRLTRFGVPAPSFGVTIVTEIRCPN